MLSRNTTLMKITTTTTLTTTAMVETGEPGGAENVIVDCHDYFSEIAKLVLFFVGTIGNILSLLVMRQQAANARSYSLTLTVLTVANSLTLFALSLDSFDHLVAKYYGSFEQHIGDLGCKLYRMFPHVVQMASHWLVVFVTAERFCAICFPLNHKLGRIFSLRGTKIILSCMFACVLASQTWRLAFDYQEPAYETEAPFNETATVIMTIPAECTARNMSVYFVIDSFINQLLLLSLLPALAILLLNSATALKIAHSGRNIRRIMSNASNLSSMLASHQREQQQVEQVQPHLNSFIAAAKRLTLSPSMTSLRQQQATLLSRTPSSATTTNRPLLTLSPSTCGGGGLSRSPSTSTAYNGIDHRKITECATKFRTRKSTVLLLTLTGCFLICLAPQLSILIYLRFYHFIYGHNESFKAFLGVCRALNITSVLSAINYADNFFIFFLAGRGFRKVIIDYVTRGWLCRCVAKILRRPFSASDPVALIETAPTTAGTTPRTSGDSYNKIARSNSCYHRSAGAGNNNNNNNVALMRNNSVMARINNNADGRTNDSVIVTTRHANNLSLLAVP